MPKKVLIAFIGDLYMSPRNTRFFKLCRERGYEIDVCCNAIKRDDRTGIRNFYSLPKKDETVSWRLYTLVLRSMRLVLPFNGIKNALNNRLADFSNLVTALEGNTYDLVYVSDLYLLPHVIRHKKNAKVLFDAREYYPRQNDESFFFRTLDSSDRARVCRKYMPLANRVITVSPGIAEKYRQEFGVNASVIMSVPSYQETKPQNEHEEVIKIVYHGMANRNRRIENMINIFKGLTIAAELHLYMVGDAGYIAELKEQTKDDTNIYFHPPVPTEKIIENTNVYDIGFCFYEPTTFNVIHCLPNKFFEFIQARLVVAIGPSPEMEAIVKKYDCGLVGSSFSVPDMTALLNNITRKEINRLKANSDRAAHELNFEKEILKLGEIIDQLG